MENLRLSDGELDAATGGSGGGCESTQRFYAGDKVMLLVYPEYGIGTVANVYMSNGIWKCTVRFDAGVMDASDIEFIPA